MASKASNSTGDVPVTLLWSRGLLGACITPPLLAGIRDDVLDESRSVSETDFLLLSYAAHKLQVASLAEDVAVELMERLL